jgi:UDP-N-acetylglucosamine 1-carboxyvinyltransferase
MSAFFEVEGGYELSGSIEVQGAKNEALQVICAALLTTDPVHFKNVPEIQDVLNLFRLLEGMGVSIEKRGKGEYRICAKNINPNYLKSPEVKPMIQKLRGSVLLIGPLLARLGFLDLHQPGGDKIGRRRLDTHFEGLMQLGATVSYDAYKELYQIKAKSLQGTSILLSEPSVTGTANLIMAAVLAKGETTIYNAACEPYIQQLCHMLNRMGAHIEGIGSNFLRIHGVSSLHGTSHEIAPDMIEIGSFIGIGAITRSSIRIEKGATIDLGNILRGFQKLGIPVVKCGDDLIVEKKDEFEIMKPMDGGIPILYDHPWPGFPPDLLSIMLVLATQCKGEILIHQKMFESRLFFVDRLLEMGAQIVLCDPHRAVVIGNGGKPPLRPIEMSSPDIRAGIALLMAALTAPGKSRIYNIEQIDRGYERIEERLQKLGAKIQRCYA